MKTGIGSPFKIPHDGNELMLKSICHSRQEETETCFERNAIRRNRIALLQNIRRWRRYSSDII